MAVVLPDPLRMGWRWWCRWRSLYSPSAPVSQTIPSATYPVVFGSGGSGVPGGTPANGGGTQLEHFIGYLIASGGGGGNSYGGNPMELLQELGDLVAVVVTE